PLLADLRLRNKLHDLDVARRRWLKVFEIFCGENHVSAGLDLVALLDLFLGQFLAGVRIDHVLLHALLRSIVEDVKPHRAILHRGIELHRHFRGADFDFTFPDSSRCHNNSLTRRNRRNIARRLSQIPVCIMNKRCCRNRDSMRLFDRRTTVDTSNRSRWRCQTTTTPRLQSLLRASIVETPVLCSVPDHNLFARQTSASEMPKKVLPQKAQKAQKFSLMLTRSIPLALKGEGGPVMWLAPAWILRHRDLRGAECCGGSKLLAEHCFVKAFHKFSRGAIVDLPE